MPVRGSMSRQSRSWEMSWATGVSARSEVPGKSTRRRRSDVPATRYSLDSQGLLQDLSDRSVRQRQTVRQSEDRRDMLRWRHTLCKTALNIPHFECTRKAEQRVQTCAERHVGTPGGASTSPLRPRGRGLQPFVCENKTIYTFDVRVTSDTLAKIAHRCKIRRSRSFM